MPPTLSSRRDFVQQTFAVSAVAAVGGRALAQAPGPRPPRLIVRGDDMGFSQSGNAGLMRCVREGIATTIEVLAPTPWFPEAVSLLANVDVDVGVHLCLTSEWDHVKWRPLTPCPSLVDADGYFFPMVRPHRGYPGRSLVENRWRLAEIAQEFRAQIELVRKHLPRVSHVTAHMGCTSLAPEVSALTKQLTREYGIDLDPAALGAKQLRYAGSKTTSLEKRESFLRALATLSPGETYWFVDHPALDTPELRAISHIGYEDVAVDRQGVVDTWTDSTVKAFIRDRGIQLISYRDLRPQP